MTVSEFFDYMKPGRVGHLIGIGGVSMSPLAEVLQARGLTIRGSDMNDSPAVEALRRKGIPVAVGHRAENVAGAEFIVRTAAVHDDNPEITAARAAGIPVFERTQAWGAIMRGYPNGVCVAGTHGKTTTTSMMTHILMEAERDPTVMIGGTLPLIGSGYRIGRGDTIVLESCEYYNSFHNFSPTVAIILNIDNDHLDFFGNLDNIKQSFRTFAALTPESGCVVYNADDGNTVAAMADIGRPTCAFGLSQEADMRAENLAEGKISRFDAVYRGQVWARVTLQVSGLHNVYNALAACAAAHALGLPPQAAERGLAAFHGAGRRAEFKGKCGGADVYDDYAHHPSEFAALMEAVSKMGYRRVLAVFQPHTFSRAKNLFEDFVRVLSIPDQLYLADIYAAREKDTLGVSSRELADRIPGAVYCPDFGELVRRLRAEARPGDIILTVGAGDIYRVGEMLVEPEA